MKNYKNAFTEAYTILNYLDENELNRIPKEILEVLEKNRNINYNYEINDKLNLKEQVMLPETKAILFNIFRDYLSTPEQKQKILRMQAEERRKKELEKQELYSKDIFSKNKKEPKKVEETLLVIDNKNVWYKNLVSFLKKIKRFIKN